ncbi:hypothetical protein LINPERHAP2_LOCUS40970 [Linum perenne]
MFGPITLSSMVSASVGMLPGRFVYFLLRSNVNLNRIWLLTTLLLMGCVKLGNWVLLDGSSGN